MIGLSQSPITSTLGHLPVKQTTINPNWAAVMIEMYKKAGLKAGDVVASLIVLGLIVAAYLYFTG